MLRRSKLGPQVVSFYRKSLRVISKLESGHQKIWYDYLRLKLEENVSLRDDKKLKKLLAAAHEEVDWVASVLERKSNQK